MKAHISVPTTVRSSVMLHPREVVRVPDDLPGRVDARRGAVLPAEGSEVAEGGAVIEERMLHTIALKGRAPDHVAEHVHVRGLTRRPTERPEVDHGERG